MVSKKVAFGFAGLMCFVMVCITIIKTAKFNRPAPVKTLVCIETDSKDGLKIGEKRFSCHEE